LTALRRRALIPAIANHVVMPILLQDNIFVAIEFHTVS
jgi:hypothetical protein